MINCTSRPSAAVSRPVALDTPVVSAPENPPSTLDRVEFGGPLYDNPGDPGLSTYGHSGGIWLTRGLGNPDQVARTVAAAGDRVPIFVQYSVPGRDNGGPSGGGADTPEQYLSGIAANARALQNHAAIVVMEPDALPLGKDPSLLKRAVETYKSIDPNVKVFLDAGHSHWRSAQDMANLMKAAGLAQADGFTSNVSNYHSTEDEKRFGQDIRQYLGRGFESELHVIDTSRNWNGEGLDAWGNPTWGDPVRARNGPVETGLAPGNRIDDHTLTLWVKPPGEADGLRWPAGQYVGTALVKPGYH